MTEVFEISDVCPSIFDFLLKVKLDSQRKLQRQKRQDDMELLAKFSVQESHMTPKVVTKAKRVETALDSKRKKNSR